MPPRISPGAGGASCRGGEAPYRLAGGALLDQGEIADHDGQQIVEVVREPAGQLSDRLEALRLAHEALADARYKDTPREHLRTEVILGKGTYVNRGNLTVGYHGMIIEHFLQVLKHLHPEYTEPELLEIKRELKAGLPPFSADTAPALIGNIIAGRIANRLDLRGPSFTVDAACASALVAIEIGPEART